MMRVLHICNAYQTNPLYQKLFKCLCDLGVIQDVLAPGEKKGVLDHDSVRIFQFKRDKGRIYRYLWPLKIWKLVSFSKKNFKIEQYHLIHAHTLFSDGAVAYWLGKKYKTNYVVAVRNTDLNDFFPLPLVKHLGYKILRQASAIYLISEANRRQFFDLLPVKIKEQIKVKVHLYPNGIDNYWLSNIYNKDCYEPQTIKLIYAGDICHNKNIHNVLNAININHKCVVSSYEAIGLKDTDKCDYVDNLKMRELELPYFHLLSKCKKEELLNKFRMSDIYIQPSYKETFGLSYIEALTQGLPLIYTIGQGIDGMFEEGEVGYAVDPNSPKDIIEKIELICSKYIEISNNIKKVDFRKYSWEGIAKNYFENYRSIVSNQ